MRYSFQERENLAVEMKTRRVEFDDEAHIAFLLCRVRRSPHWGRHRDGVLSPTNEHLPGVFANHDPAKFCIRDVAHRRIRRAV